jgi:hypothetical protein
MLRAADRRGVLVWSENLVYGTAQFDNRNVLAETEKQLDEEIGTSRIMRPSSYVPWLTKCR